MHQLNSVFLLIGLLLGRIMRATAPAFRVSFMRALPRPVRLGFAIAALPIAGGASLSHIALAENALTKMILSPKDAATSAQNSSSFDMRGFDHVDIELLVGAITGTIDMKIQDSADNSSFTDVSPGQSITQFAATDDDKTAIMSVAWKEKGYRRYGRVVITPTGGTTNFVAATCRRYGKTGELPVTQETTTKELKKVA